MHTDSLPRSDRDEVPEAAPAEPTLRGRLADTMEKLGLTQAKAAGKLGISSAQLNQYLLGKYLGDVPRLERKVAEFLGNEERRRQAGVETIACEQTLAIKAALELIRKTNDVGVVLAESGEGKTRAIEHYRIENPLCVLFHVRSWCNDKHGVEGALFTAVGKDGYDNRTSRSLWMIKKMKGSDRLLIVDDAHKLTRPALQWVFDFHDETGIPVALIGTFALEDKLADDAQRFRRVGYRHELRPEQPAELIAHLVRTLAPGAVNGEAAKLEELCGQLVGQRGHFGDCHKQLKLAAEIKSGHAALSWEKAFRAAHTKMFRDRPLH